VRSGVTVTYQVGSHQFKTTISSIIVTCPPGSNQDRCLYRGFDGVTPAPPG
jgi:hypothetical protein